MGINGLHKALKEAGYYKRESLKSFPGINVAIDASTFMMKCCGCAREFFLNSEYSKTQKPWVDILFSLTKLLKENEIKPIFVFDGYNKHPMKQETRDKRKQVKIDAMNEALQLENQGDIESAKKKWIQAFEITDEMIEDATHFLSEQKIEWRQGSYEADQMMAHLYKSDLVDAVITEDSDMIGYGVERIFFKLSWDGEFDLFDLSQREMTTDFKKTIVRIDALSKQQRMMLCILCGNDYITNWQRGVGIKKIYTKLLEGFDFAHALEQSEDHDEDYKSRFRYCISLFNKPEEFC